MSEQAELNFGRDELFDPRASAESEEASAGNTSPAGVAGLAALSDGPLRRLVEQNFIRYASYVIRDRAIPDLDDGLKPVQRRILYSLHENDDGKFIKVANIVGYTMQYHPHGDASIGDALVTLVNKRFLIEGQGNFGNLLTGDPAAAPRYIECRLTELARTELFHEELTSFVPTYDGRRREPVSLPVKIPLLLMLGADGIAVGIATRILPHNPAELIEAQIAILRGKPFAVFPDFPQGGQMDASTYEEGRGHVQVRARIEKKDPQTLVIRELPFGTTTESVIESIEEAARKNKVPVRGIQDFTAGQVEIEIRLCPEQDAERAMEALYAFTQCQVQIPSRIVVIRNRRPEVMDVPAILRHGTERLVRLLEAELRLEQQRLAETLHRRSLVQIFVEQRLYKSLEACRTPAAMGQAIRDGLAPFGVQLPRTVNAEDVEMLLEIPIRRISQVDLDANRKEMDQIRAAQEQGVKHLAELVPYTIRYLRNLLKKYGAEFPRRTQIVAFQSIAVRELTATELKIGYDRPKGYLGFKVAGETRLECSSYDKLLLLWQDGRYRVLPPPEKLFVDNTLLHAAILDRDRVLTVVYTEDFFTYIKKFTVGGVIQNRDYRCIPRGMSIRFLTEDPPPILYVQYVPGDRQKIPQQEFAIGGLPVRDRDARGALMTSKKIRYIGAVKPADWDDTVTGPPGTIKDFV